MEDYAWVVEYLPSGRPSQIYRESIVQLVGDKFFTLLEATVKPDASLMLGQKVYVGKEGRQEVERIKGRIQFSDLTNASKETLPAVLKKIIQSREKEFVDFLNRARPVSIRVHTLDLLPGVGKKNMEALLQEREKQPFESFEDLKKRIPTITDPMAIFVHRILSELQGNEKYYLFTKPPSIRERGRRY
ncbi:MAG TPA: DUF655 domain-containing protein [Candidatus Bilamarchaeaceae archaeon]|nr:DUF655 domain-containing protein [Candidatus Bilamarchaeaceae archaeon]